LLASGLLLLSTAGAQRLVVDINQTPPAVNPGSSPARIFDLGGTAVFAANDGRHGNEPWRTDGTGGRDCAARRRLPWVGVGRELGGADHACRRRRVPSLSGVRDLEGSVAEFSCPHCHHPFPVVQVCECKAPVIALHLHIGGVVKFCTRNGCTKHWLEFQDADDLFTLFESLAG